MEYIKGKSNHVADLLSRVPNKTGEKGTITTKDGLKIKIYRGDIMKAKVKCIVNAANEKLIHNGGVAAAISKAAGRRLVREGTDYIRRHGPLQVGSCLATTAGNLPYDCIIHTVGPRWDSYEDKERCLYDLQQAVFNTLQTAANKGMKSIAIPSISAGIFGVPKIQCTEQYHKAVINFSQTNEGKQNILQEIHFVDKDTEMVQLLQEEFEETQWRKPTPEDDGLDLDIDDRAFEIGAINSNEFNPERLCQQSRGSTWRHTETGTRLTSRHQHARRTRKG